VHHPRVPHRKLNGQGGRGSGTRASVAKRCWP
jgi:hypothetical protein